MSAPLPNALRARFQKLVEEGLSGRAAALRLKVSHATGARWGQAIRRTGQAHAAPQGRPKGKGKLDPHHAFFSQSTWTLSGKRDDLLPQSSISSCASPPVALRDKRRASPVRRLFCFHTNGSA